MLLEIVRCAAAAFASASALKLAPIAYAPSLHGCLDVGSVWDKAALLSLAKRLPRVLAIVGIRMVPVISLSRPASQGRSRFCCHFLLCSFVEDFVALGLPCR